MLNLNNLTISEFRKFVGGKVFTAVFRKKDGTVRTMNARLKVAKYVKGTQPEVTAKRNATLTEQNMIGVYEMRGTSDRVEEGTPDDELFVAKNYRTLNLETLLGLNANGEKLVNEVANREGWEGWD
jgi:hypothetical protein